VYLKLVLIKIEGK